LTLPLVSAMKMIDSAGQKILYFALLAQNPIEL
jgi:hypothetical protein